VIAIAIMHAAFAPGREAVLARCLERSGLGLAWVGRRRLHVEYDEVGRGVWPVARDCWQWACEDAEDSAHWCIVLNDDSLPCEHFVEVATAALRSRGSREPVCFYTNHERSSEALAAGQHWVTTPDGLVGVGAALHSSVVPEFLAFNERYVRQDVPFPDDARINLWAMATGRRIWTTIPSLVDHQLPDESLVGNLKFADRRPIVPPLDDMRGIDWSGDALHLGRKYRGSHWNLRKMLTDEGVRAHDAVRRMYALERETGAQ
jgi:hypothetical protein